MIGLPRLVLNEEGPGRAAAGEWAPGLAGAPGPEAAERLIAGMLRGVGAHLDSRGAVDGPGLRGSPEWPEIVARAGDLGRVDLGALATREVRLAFWLDVYNALALHGIVALGLRRSVWETWNFFGRVSYRIGGHVWSLDEIEHGVLRGNRRRVLPPWPPFRAGDPRHAATLDRIDPRVHFALNCGARSCPPVGVYRPAGLDAQLDLAARNFVNEEVVLEPDGLVACSRLFKWFAADFGSPADLRRFLLCHLEQGPVRVALEAGAPPCRRFRPYSWALAHRPREG